MDLDFAGDSTMTSFLPSGTDLLEGLLAVQLRALSSGLAVECSIYQRAEHVEAGESRLPEVALHVELEDLTAQRLLEILLVFSLGSGQ
ncbi:hypothetical protein GCM10009650_13520 [Nesterenkonia jeotgali]